MVQEAMSSSTLPVDTGDGAAAKAGGAGDDVRRPSRVGSWSSQAGGDTANCEDAKEHPDNFKSESYALAPGLSASVDDRVGTSALNLLSSTSYTVLARPVDSEPLASCEATYDETGHLSKSSSAMNPSKLMPPEVVMRRRDRTPSKLSEFGATAMKKFASKVDPFQATVTGAGAMLACCAGMVNVICFYVLGTFVSHVTGTLSKAAIHTADAVFKEAYIAALLILSFVVGSAICGCLIAKSTVTFDDPLYGVALLGNSAMLIIAGLTHKTDAAPFFAAAACGLQNGMATSYSGAVIRTTHVTGLLTDLGLIIGRMVVSGTRLQYSRVRHLESIVDPWEEFRRFVLLLILATSFFFGCMLGSALYGGVGSSALWVPAIVTGLAGMYYSAYRFFCPHKPLHKISTYGGLPQEMARASNAMFALDSMRCWASRASHSPRTARAGDEPDMELDDGVMPREASSDSVSADYEAQPDGVSSVSMRIPASKGEPEGPPEAAPEALPAGIAAPPPASRTTARRIVAALDNLEAAFADLAAECAERGDVMEACDAHRALRGKVAHLVC